VNANPELKKWHTETYRARLPGLQVPEDALVRFSGRAAVPVHGEPLRDAHCDLHITPDLFDESINVELARALDHFKVPAREKAEVLAAFYAQKKDVTAGSLSVAR